MLLLVMHIAYCLQSSTCTVLYLLNVKRELVNRRRRLVHQQRRVMPSRLLCVCEFSVLSPSDVVSRVDLTANVVLQCLYTYTGT